MLDHYELYNLRDQNGMIEAVVLSKKGAEQVLESVEKKYGVEAQIAEWLVDVPDVLLGVLREDVVYLAEDATIK